MEPNSTTQNPTLNPSDLLVNFWVFQATYVAACLGIADLLQEKGALTNVQIADHLHVHPDSLGRLLRVLTSVGIFQQNPDNSISLNQGASSLLADTPGSLKNLIIMNGSQSHWNAWGNLLECVKTGKGAYEITHGKSYFKYLEGHPDEAQLFHQAMCEISGVHAPHIARIYPFSAQQTIVDIGGGKGLILQEILKTHPTAKGILFDLPHSAELPRLQDADMQKRLEFISGSFFASVPAGGDIYLLVNILHDWPDEDCLKILKNCRKAMGPQSKLLVIELTSPESGEFHPGKLLDLEMLILAAGRERTLSEFKPLFDASGFKKSRVIPTPTLMQIIELLPV